ncbi:DUF2474 domain-containing protein [Rhizorhabdus histidinilytica]|jgi:hypothetical protein|nr:DUF2474 domain-containing protein [Rhizorhabdus histidinilytica]QEH78124.1 DUF2474 domain-containing protein [Sphingomonas sp. C8-2]
MKPATTEPGPLWRRLAWFVGIWAASVAVLGLVAWAIRRMING